MSAFPRWLHRCGWPVWWTAAGLALLLVVLQLSLFAWEKIAWATHPDRAVFRQTCSPCHSETRAHSYAKAPREWEKTVERMLAKENSGGDKVGPEARQQIARLLTDLRSADGRTLYRLRCGKCHSRSELKPYLVLHPPALRLLLQQHIAQNNFIIQVWEGKMILDHILDLQNQIDRTASASPSEQQVLYQQSCGICHTVRFLYRTMCEKPKSGPQWEQTIARMREKTPAFIQVESLPALTEHAQAICRSGAVAP